MSFARSAKEAISILCAAQLTVFVAIPVIETWHELGNALDFDLRDEAVPVSVEFDEGRRLVLQPNVDVWCGNSLCADHHEREHDGLPETHLIFP